jgi:hypothetical protein
MDIGTTTNNAGTETKGGYTQWMQGEQIKNDGRENPEGSM